MTLPAARMGDLVLQTSPHCHAPMHPVALVPTPMPHPPMPLALITGAPTVLIGKKPAARMTDKTAQCVLPGCVPGGPGVVAMASTSVMIGGMFAARVGDQTTHVACVGPIPGPLGKILPPGCPTVLIG